MQVHPEFLYSHSTAETNLAGCFYTRGAGVFNKIPLSSEEQQKFVSYMNQLDEGVSFGDDIKKTIIATEVLLLINNAFLKHTSSGKQTGGNTIKAAIDYIMESRIDPKGGYYERLNVVHSCAFDDQLVL